jgi:diguanylate cyclase (GGDEF)-like protein/PAS domain S-box-containing protein
MTQMSREKPPETIKINRIRMLCGYFLFLVLFMLFSEYVKDAIFSTIAAWESRGIAVLMTGIAGTAGAFILLRSMERINHMRSTYLQELGITKEALQEKEEMYRSLVESTDDSIYVVARDTGYLFINKKHRVRMGLAEDQYQGFNYARFHSPAESIDFRKQVDAVIKAGESVQFEHKSQRDNRFFLRTFSPVRNSVGWITAVTVVSTDITRQKELEESLRALSITDALTGLHNRRGLFALADQQIKLANRSRKCLYVLYADLDNLKTINDKFGHQEGDAALKTTADILRKTFRESDTIARIGGDEFVVIAGSDEKRNSGLIQKRLQQGLDAYNTEAHSGYKLAFSIGIVFYDPQRPVSFEDLMNEADRIMSIKKKENRSS